jgi:hypothetical protein
VGPSACSRIGECKAVVVKPLGLKIPPCDPKGGLTRTAFFWSKSTVSFTVDGEDCVFIDYQDKGKK